MFSIYRIGRKAVRFPCQCVSELLGQTYFCLARGKGAAGFEWGGGYICAIPH